MNIYRFNFIARCPTNGKLISYAYELRKPDNEKVLVEHIKTAAALLDSGFHEDIADILFSRFGGVQILKANHHEVDIETHRGADPKESGRLAERVVIGKTVFEKGVEVSAVVDHLRAK